MSACGFIYWGGFSNVFDCVRDEGHEGSHRSFGGSEWDEPTPQISGNTVSEGDKP